MQRDRSSKRAFPRCASRVYFTKLSSEATESPSLSSSPPPKQTKKINNHRGARALTKGEAVGIKAPLAEGQDTLAETRAQGATRTQREAWRGTRICQIFRLPPARNLPFEARLRFVGAARCPVSPDPIEAAALRVPRYSPHL